MARALLLWNHGVFQYLCVRPASGGSEYGSQTFVPRRSNGMPRNNVGGGALLESGGCMRVHVRSRHTDIKKRQPPRGGSKDHGFPGTEHRVDPCVFISFFAAKFSKVDLRLYSRRYFQERPRYLTLSKSIVRHIWESESGLCEGQAHFNFEFSAQSRAYGEPRLYLLFLLLAWTGNRKGPFAQALHCRCRYNGTSPV